MRLHFRTKIFYFRNLKSFPTAPMSPNPVPGVPIMIQFGRCWMHSGWLFALIWWIQLLLVVDGRGNAPNPRFCCNDCCCSCCCVNVPRRVEQELWPGLGLWPEIKSPPTNTIHELPPIQYIFEFIKTWPKAYVLLITNRRVTSCFRYFCHFHFTPLIIILLTMWSEKTILLAQVIHFAQIWLVIKISY